MFTLMEVRCSVRPICSAIPMNLRAFVMCWSEYGSFELTHLVSGFSQFLAAEMNVCQYYAEAIRITFYLAIHVQRIRNHCE